MVTSQKMYHVTFVNVFWSVVLINQFIRQMAIDNNP